jgi:hypothetical protein
LSKTKYKFEGVNKIQVKLAIIYCICRLHFFNYELSILAINGGGKLLLDLREEESEEFADESVVVQRVSVHFADGPEHARLAVHAKVGEEVLERLVEQSAFSAHQSGLDGVCHIGKWRRRRAPLLSAVHHGGNVRGECVTRHATHAARQNRGKHSVRVRIVSQPQAVKINCKIKMCH